MSEQNGHTPTYQELREELRCAKARRQLRRLQVEDRVERQLAPLTENYWGYTGGEWGDFVDPSDAFRDPDLKGFNSPFVSAGGGRYDRQDGRNRPFVTYDIDLDFMRTQARWLATRNPIAVGVLDCLGDYTVRQGYDYEARPKKPYLHDRTALTLASLVQEVVEETKSANSLDDEDGEETIVWADREREAVLRSVTDGDVFVRGFDQGEDPTLFRFGEPEQVRKPLGSPPEWDFGIHSPRHDVERRKGYAVAYGQPDDWEEVPACDMAHLKMNVGSNIKRGISDFYCTAEMLDQTWKLLRNLAIVGSIQSAIPWIEQFESATGEQLDNFIKGKIDQGRPQIQNPITGRPSNFRKYQPGEIPHVTRGRTYLPQPQAQNAPNHVTVVQAGMRSLGSRWRMPEYMISGDASNANYASTLVAGSPFVVRTECRQAGYGRFFVRVLWMSIRNAARAGRFQVNGRVFAWREVARYVDVIATPPQVAIANPAEEAQIDHADMDRGVLSIQTRQARRGLDSEQERKNLAEMPLPGPGGQQPGAGGVAPGAGPPPGGDDQGGQGDDLLGLGELLGEAKHQKGEKWQGASGGWFTVNDKGHVTPTAAPAVGGAGGGQGGHKAAVVKAILAGAGNLKAAAGRIFRKLKIQARKGAATDLATGQQDLVARKKLARVAHLAAAVEHKVMLGFSKAKQAVEAVARAKGASPETAQRAAQVIGTIDTALAWTVSFPAVTALTGSAGAGKVASFLPVASLAYLAFSTSTNPMATLRAARAALSKAPALAHESLDQEAVAQLVDLLGGANDPDMAQALVMAILDRNGHDLARAVRQAQEALGQAAESLDYSPTWEDLQEATARQVGDKWQGTSGRWFTKRPDGRVVPTAGPKKDAPAKPQKAAKATVDEVHAKVQEMRKAGRASPADARELAGHIFNLTVAQSNELKKRLNLKASGPKAELGRKIAERALAAAKESNPRHQQAHDALRSILGDELDTHDLGDVEGLKAKLKAKLGGAEAKQDRPSPPVTVDPAKAFGSMKAAYDQARQTRAGVAKVPDLVDAMKADQPGLTDQQAHALLQQWQKEDRITLQLVNDPRLEPRAGEMIKTASGLRGYVQMRPEQAKPAPAAREPAPSADHAPLAQAFASLEQQHHGLVPLADLKDALGWSNERMHAAIKDLRRQGVLTTQAHEGRTGTPAEKKRLLSASFADEAGDPQAYVSVRQGSEGKLQALAGGKAKPAAPKSTPQTEPMAGHPFEGKSREEIVRSLGELGYATQRNANPWGLKPEDPHGLVPEVVELVRQAKGANSLTRPSIRQLYSAVRERHPEVSLRDFQQALYAGQQGGKLRLDPYTLAKGSASTEDLRHMMPLDRESKFHVDLR